MMNYIGANGQFINLAAIAVIEDVSDDGRLMAQLTTIAGAIIDIVDDDAEALFKRIEIIAMETDAAEHKLRMIIQAEGVPQP